MRKVAVAQAINREVSVNKPFKLVMCMMWVNYFRGKGEKVRIAPLSKQLMVHWMAAGVNPLH